MKNSLLIFMPKFMFKSPLMLQFQLLCLFTLITVAPLSFFYSSPLFAQQSSSQASAASVKKKTKNKSVSFSGLVRFFERLLGPHETRPLTDPVYSCLQTVDLGIEAKLSKALSRYDYHGGMSLEEQGVRMLKQKEILNEYLLPIFTRILEEGEQDLLIITIGPGFVEEHLYPQLAAEYLQEKKSVTIINLDPALRNHPFYQETGKLKVYHFPLLFPGHDGSGYFPRPTIHDERTLGSVEAAITKANGEKKQVLLLTTASGYPQDTVIRLWNRWKETANGLFLVQAYAQTPTIIFDRHGPFPERKEMLLFLQTKKLKKTFGQLLPRLAHLKKDDLRP